MKRSFAAVALAGLAVFSTACVGGGGPPPGPTDPRDLLVVGDSVGYQLGCYLGHKGSNPDVPAGLCPMPGGADWNKTWNGASGGCSLSQGAMLLYNGGLVTQASHPACYNFTSQYQQLIAQHDPKVVVLLTAGWEIIDRWITNSQPAGSNGNWSPPTHQWGYEIQNTPGWWDTTEGQHLENAINRYRDQLHYAVNILKSGGAKVIIVNAAYIAPPCPEPATGTLAQAWWEPYPATAPGNSTKCPDPNDAGLCNPPESYQDCVSTPWTEPNSIGTPYRSSKVKIDQFNQYLQVIWNGLWGPGSNNPNPNVELFDNHQWFQVNGEMVWDSEFRQMLCPAPNPPGDDPTDGCDDGQAPQNMRATDLGHMSPDGLELMGCALIPRIRQLLGKPNPTQLPPQCQTPT